MNLLILDDWGLSPFNALEGRELLEIVEDRFQTGSTILVSQLPVESWYELFTDPTIADAILDRLVHNAHRINMHGESMRKLLQPDK
jgi:DNA replication protein DnaC